MGHEISTKKQGRLGCELGGEAAAPQGRRDLAGAPVHLVRMQHHLCEVEPHRPEVLLAQDALLGGPLEGARHRVPDVVQVLGAHCAVHHHVGPVPFGPIAPDLALGLLLVPAEPLAQNLGARFWVHLGAQNAILQSLSQFLLQWLCSEVQPVVLARRLGQAGLAGLLRHRLTVRHHGVGHGEVALGEFLPQVLQTDLHVQLAAASDDVLAALLGAADHQLVRFRELLQTFHQLGQVLAVLRLHCHLHHGRDAVLHVRKVVGILQGGDGAGLEYVLVHPHQCHGVTARHVLDGLRPTAHHQHGALDGLHVQVILAARPVVRALDAYLLSGADRP